MLRNAVGSQNLRRERIIGDIFAWDRVVDVNRWMVVATRFWLSEIAKQLRHLTRCLHCGTIIVPSNYLFMAKRLSKRTPVIPEPSPRFAFWSGVAVVIVLAIVMTLDYVNGWVR